jgi:ABC-type Zn2+ transport system substrate-binding protein/surface adhesin
MSLSHLETAALRLAIARDDPTIRFALETFRLNRDEVILMDTLRDVARQTINETLNEAGYEGLEEEDSPSPTNEMKNGNDERDEEDNQEDNEDEDDDDDEEDDDEDDEDEDDDAAQKEVKVSQAARKHLFPILIGELLKESVISQRDCKTLLDLFEEDDDVINAALDVYDLDSDLSELVDTLQRIVRTSSRE